MKKFIFLFLSFSSSLFSAEITSTLHINKDKLLIDEELKVQFDIVYPAALKPDLFSFLYELNRRPSNSFRIAASTVSYKQQIGDQQQLLLSFELVPLHLGTCIFTPGILSFGQKSEILVPAVEVECLPTGLSSLMLTPLLPLHPETKIRLSAENRALIQSTAMLLKEQSSNVARFSQYQRAWNVLTFSLFAVAFAALLLWCLVEFELLQKAARLLIPKEDPVEKLLKELRDKQLSINQRSSLFVQLLRAFLSKVGKANSLHMTSPELLKYIDESTLFTVGEKEYLTTVLKRIDEICFGQRPTSEEEWQQLSQPFLQRLSNL